MSLLSDEYKILQDKIDKIGGFRFTIKGWAVTVSAGILVAIASGKGISLFLGASAIDFLLVFFFIFERQQVRLGWKFSNRVRLIELEFDRRRRKREHGGRSFSTPNIAGTVSKTKTLRPGLIKKHFPNQRVERLRNWVNAEFRLAMSAEFIFYILLGVAAWVPYWANANSDASSPSITIQNITEETPNASSDNASTPSPSVKASPKTVTPSITHPHRDSR